MAVMQIFVHHQLFFTDEKLHELDYNIFTVKSFPPHKEKEICSIQ